MTTQGSTTLTISSEFLQFGTINPDADALPAVSLVVRNNGAERVPVGFGLPDWLSVEPTNMVQLGPGQEQEFTIRLKPNLPRPAGQPSISAPDAIRLISFNYDQCIGVAYTLVSAKLRLSVPALNFGEVSLSASLPEAEGSFVVSNTGAAAMTGTVKAAVPWLKVVDGEIHLLPGQSIEVNVLLLKNKPRPARGASVTQGQSLVIQTNGGNSSLDVSYSVSKKELEGGGKRLGGLLGGALSSMGLALVAGLQSTDGDRGRVTVTADSWGDFLKTALLIVLLGAAAGAAAGAIFGLSYLAQVRGAGSGAAWLAGLLNALLGFGALAVWIKIQDGTQPVGLFVLAVGVVTVVVGGFWPSGALLATGLSAFLGFGLLTVLAVSVYTTSGYWFETNWLAKVLSILISLATLGLNVWLAVILAMGAGMWTAVLWGAAMGAFHGLLLSGVYLLGKK